MLRIDDGEVDDDVRTSKGITIGPKSLGWQFGVKEGCALMDERGETEREEEEMGRKAEGLRGRAGASYVYPALAAPRHGLRHNGLCGQKKYTCPRKGYAEMV